MSAATMSFKAGGITMSLTGRILTIRKGRRLAAAPMTYRSQRAARAAFAEVIADEINLALFAKGDPR